MTNRFYIKLNQPRKEDGNTFGVEVQNEIISDMNDAMDGSRQLLSDMISYFSTRASIVAAVGFSSATIPIRVVKILISVITPRVSLQTITRSRKMFEYSVGLGGAHPLEFLFSLKR